MNTKVQVMKALPGIHCAGTQVRIYSFQHEIISLRCSRTNWKDYSWIWTLSSQGLIIPLSEKVEHPERLPHLFGDSCDEGGWSGGGNEREGVPRRAGGVSSRAKRQPHCDAKQGSEKKEKRKEALEI